MNRADDGLRNAYTDSPDLHPRALVAAAQLMVWLTFHPSAWRNYLARASADIPPAFSIIGLSSRQRQDPGIRRLLWAGHVIWPALVILPLCAITLVLAGGSIPRALLAVTVCGLVMACLSVIAGLATGMLAGAAAIGAGACLVVLYAALPVDRLLLRAAGAGIALGLAGNGVACLAEKRRGSILREVGGALMGVVFAFAAVALAIAAAMIFLPVEKAAGLAIPWPASLWAGLAPAAPLALTAGVSGWRYRRRRIAWAGAGLSLAFGALLGLAFASADPTVLSLAYGAALGAFLTALFALPYLAAQRFTTSPTAAIAGMIGASGLFAVLGVADPGYLNPPALASAAAGLALGFTWPMWRPVALYPAAAVFNLILYRLDERRSARSPCRLRWHPAFWDEAARLRYGGLDEHLILAAEHNPAEARAAIARLADSPQRWAAQAAQIEVEARRLERCPDIVAIASAHDRLPAGLLPGAAGALLLSFSRISQDVETALNHTAAYHRRLDLADAASRLDTLRKELMLSDDPRAARFYAIAERWENLVARQAHVLAHAVELSQEIDNPYIVGVPLTEQQEVFVGRDDISARIEQLLLDRRRPPLMVFGQRRMGKTSLLRNLGRLLPNRIAPLFVDGEVLSGANDYADLLYSMTREMVKSARAQRNLALPAPDRDRLARNPSTYFNEWLDAVEDRLGRDGHDMALLTLDEFETLITVTQRHNARYDDRDMLHLMRHLIQHRPRFKVLLASSHSPEEFQQWAGYLVNLQVIKIGYLSESDTRRLVEHPVDDFALRYEPAALARIYGLTRGHPALVQLLCYEIVNLKNEQAPDQRRLATPSDVEAALTPALSNGGFIFADMRRNQINDAADRVLRLAATLGEGATLRGEEIAARLSMAEAELEDALALLLRRDLLERAAGGYRFQVEMVRRAFV